MTLLIFNNGTHTDPPSGVEQIKPQQHALKELDLSLPSSPLKQPESYTKEKEQSALRHTPVVASPLQTLSYTSTQKVADSLENRRRLSAAHIMSFPVITAMPHQLVLKAKLLMLECDISHIIIVNKEQQPLGLLTTKEILAVESPETSFIQSILDFNVMAVSEDTLVRDIALIFMKHKASAFSVVNADHKVVGIITRTDLLSLLVSGPNQEVTA